MYRFNLFDSHNISVAHAWRGAIAAAPDPMNEMSFCAPEAVESYNADSPDKFETNLASTYRIALKLKLLELSEDYAGQYLAVALKYGPKALAAGPQNLGFLESDNPRYFALQSFCIPFAYAMAKSIAELQVPDQALLKAGAQRVLANSKIKGLRASNMSDDERGWLLQITLCALLAHDLTLAKNLLAISKKYLSHPQQFEAVKAMLDGAQETLVDGKPRVRITQGEGLEAFFKLYNWYRWPTYPDVRTAMYPDGVPALREFIFFEGIPVLGNYFLTWLYLQCVEPQRQDQTDWDTIKYLMRS